MTGHLRDDTNVKEDDMSGNLSIPHPQKSKTLSRAVLATGIALLLTGAIPFGMHGDSDSFPPASPQSATSASPDPSLTPEDLRLLDDIQSRALVYFVDHTDPRTGLTRDRAPANGLPSSAPASIGASGFALAAWTIAVDRGWLPPEAGRREVTSTLSFLLNGADQVHGWFYHYVDVHTGRRAWHSEVSTIDTALLLQGALFAREYFRDPQITTLVDALYRRVDWTWALDGGTTLSLGWRPETGFLPYRWNTYSECGASAPLLDARLDSRPQVSDSETCARSAVGQARPSTAVSGHHTRPERSRRAPQAESF